ncbi:MAG: NnrS family protein [Campylobacteraceae bacterium]
MANAAKHYLHYPKDEINTKPYLAFGFRPFFLILPWYVAFMILLWGFSFGFSINLLPFSNIVHWHIYELLFGVGGAALGAFLLTALPELYAGNVPIVGKKLLYIVLLWICARVSFWCMDIFGVWVAFLFNVSFFILLIAIAFKPVVLDTLQRHSSIAYILVLITIVQSLFFLSVAGVLTCKEPNSFLYLSLSLFIALVILALRRIHMEEINEFIEEMRMSERFFARAFRYNLSIFCVLLFGFYEFFHSDSVLGWMGIAIFCATLNIMNDYKREYDKTLLTHPFVLFLATLLFVISFGYIFLGFAYLGFDFSVSNARHILGIGGFGGGVLVAMFVVSFVHTGRKPKCDIWVFSSFLLLLISLVFRYFTLELGSIAYTLSSLCFALCFIVYFFRFKNYLLNKRADGLLG